MGKSFQKIDASSVGNFGDNTDKIPQWIRANGGVYVKEIDDSVTHLVATEAAVKKNVEAVRKAKRFKHIKIVTYDWLEDSLRSKTRRPKRKGPYLWERILKEQKKKAVRDSKVQNASSKKTTKKRNNQRGVNAAKSLEDFAKGARAIVSEMESSGYHLYTDQKTGVTYCATLVRPSVVQGRKGKYIAKYGPIFQTQPLPRNHPLRVSIYNPFAQQLQLYESDTTPPVYATYVKYSRVGASGKQPRPGPGRVQEVLPDEDGAAVGGAANDACAIARCDDMEIVATTMTEDCDSDTDNDHREPTQYCRFQCPASVDSDDDDDGDGSSTANAADAETGSSQLI